MDAVDRFFQYEAEQFRNLSRIERFRQALMAQVGNRYVSGRENWEEADCSGLLTIPLFLACGYRLRGTADNYYRQVFISRPNGIDCMFCITPKAVSNHHGRNVAAGTATHVMGFVAPGIVLNTTLDGAIIQPIKDAVHYWEHGGYRCDIRGIDHDRAKKLSGKLLYGLDPSVRKLMRAGK